MERERVQPLHSEFSGKKRGHFKSANDNENEEVLINIYK